MILAVSRHNDLSRDKGRWSGREGALCLSCWDNGPAGYTKHSWADNPTGRGQAQGPLVHPAPLLVPTVGARLLGEREGTAGQAQGPLVRPAPHLVPTVGARLV